MHDNSANDFWIVANVHHYGALWVLLHFVWLFLFMSNNGWVCYMC